MSVRAMYSVALTMIGSLIAILSLMASAWHLEQVKFYLKQQVDADARVVKSRDYGHVESAQSSYIKSAQAHIPRVWIFMILSIVGALLV